MSNVLLGLNSIEQYQVSGKINIGFMIENAAVDKQSIINDHNHNHNDKQHTIHQKPKPHMQHPQGIAHARPLEASPAA
jgi:hypothetical protein